MADTKDEKRIPVIWSPGEDYIVVGSQVLKTSHPSKSTLKKQAEDITAVVDAFILNELEKLAMEKPSQ